MISLETNIHNAKILYDTKDYVAAMKMCRDLIGVNKDEKEAYLIAAKSMLFTQSFSISDEEAKDSFLVVFQSACNKAKTIEEVYELLYEIESTLYEREADNIKVQLEALENDPTLDRFKKYINLPLDYLMLRISAGIFARESDAVIAYCEANGIAEEGRADILEKEFGSKNKVTNRITKEEMHILERNTAHNIFVTAQKELDANKEGSVDYIKSIVRKISSPLSTAESLISVHFPERGENPDLRCNSLKLKAEIISYYLSALVYPNGIAISLYSGDRSDKVNELKELYSEVKELDPSFQPPPLPNVMATKAPTQTSGGGCYVATAVYGSYDCPQVWTLRRYRDYTLAETWYGRAFIKTYYAISPTLVKWFGKTNWFKKLCKGKIDCIVANLQAKGVESTFYEDRKW